MIKFSIAAILGLFTSAAMACPELTGRYICKADAEEVSVVTIDQSVNNEITTYKVDTEGDVVELVADGVEKRTSLQDDMALSLFVGCWGDSVVVKLELLEESTESLIERMSLALFKDGENLEVTEVNTYIENGEEQEDVTVYNCQKDGLSDVIE